MPTAEKLRNDVISDTDMDMPTISTRTMQRMLNDLGHLQAVNALKDKHGARIRADVKTQEAIRKPQSADSVRSRGQI
ncbi:hypothetical protein HPB50_007009 [Hyalomma asiaticum]|uniref:Uncharacterized protein n=1 Tax=Hyalomma asiaticum TaxID=266040 RepID=A0ACB7SP93_HYAAI|nr:hypothetical protein HPB50_007009 [Hyalomma asiaticum]